MSKTIDLSEGYSSLTDDEVMYLANRDDSKAQRECQKRDLAPFGSPKDWENHPYFGDANTKGVTEADIQRQVAASPHHPEVSEDDDDEDEDDDEVSSEEDDDPVDYNDKEWTVTDLRGELKTRGLDVTGNRSDLVTRLEEDDAKED